MACAIPEPFWYTPLTTRRIRCWRASTGKTPSGVKSLVEAKEETIENLQELIETVCQIDSLGAEQERLEQELRIIAENLANLIQKNASVALDQTEQAEKEKKLRTLYGEKHSRFLELESLIQEKNDTREILTNFITKLEDLTGEQQ